MHTLIICPVQSSTRIFSYGVRSGFVSSYLEPRVWCEWRATVFLPYSDELVYNSLKKYISIINIICPQCFLLFFGR